MDWKNKSHPSRVRGLKHYVWSDFLYKEDVAPLAGAWIETGLSHATNKGMLVAPLAGAWIETGTGKALPKRRNVAPLAGAWIETCPE